jgi:hypothetical protein
MKTPTIWVGKVQIVGQWAFMEMCFIKTQNVEQIYFET